MDQSDIETWRKEPFPTVQGLDSNTRISRIERYRQIKQSGAQLTIDELRHVIELIAADRAEVSRRKAADTREGKKANAAAAPIKFDLNAL